MSSIRYVWDVATDTPCLEVDGGEAASVVTAEPHIYGPSVSLRRGEGTCYLHYDCVSSIRQETNDSQSITAVRDFGAFGTAMLPNAPSTGYAGGVRYMDGGTTLSLYVRHRMYGAAIGSWLSRDPVEDPLSPNPYIYVLNAPTNYVDPSGLYIPPRCRKWCKEESHHWFPTGLKTKITSRCTKVDPTFKINDYTTCLPKCSGPNLAKCKCNCGVHNYLHSGWHGTPGGLWNVTAQ